MFTSSLGKERGPTHPLHKELVLVLYGIFLL